MSEQDTCSHEWSEFGSTCKKCNIGRGVHEIGEITGVIGRCGEGPIRVAIDYEKLFHSLAMRHNGIYHALENNDHEKAISIAKVTDEIIGNAYKKFEADYRIK